MNDMFGVELEAGQKVLLARGGGDIRAYMELVEITKVNPLKRMISVKPLDGSWGSGIPHYESKFVVVKNPEFDTWSV